MILLVVVSISILSDCSSSMNDTEKVTKELEKETLDQMLQSSEEELDALVSRGKEDMVDWKLAREFANVSFENMQIDGTYKMSSKLRKLPIVVYNSDGEVKYYKFRVVDENNIPIGAITTVAKETEGYPIAYRLLFSKDYNDDLEKLFNQGKITKDNLLRVVTNNYPNYAIGVMEATRGDVKIGTTFDPTTGEQKNSDELAQQVKLDEYIKEHPEHKDKLSGAIEEMNQFKEEVDSFWEEANSRKDNIRESVSRKMYSKGILPEYNRVEDLGLGNWGDFYSYKEWCGPAAGNFVLGYMNYRGLISYNPKDLDTFKKLEDKLDTILKFGVIKLLIGELKECIFMMLIM